MTLRARPAEERVVLPDGRSVLVRVGVAEDPYVAKREVETVSLELWADDEVLAALTTILDPGQVSEAKALVREVAAGLESGDLAPTAGALEPLADRLPAS